MNNFIHITNLPADTDRQFVINLFRDFGTIKKVYICPTISFAKVYFEEKIAPDAAVDALNGKPPHHLCVTIQAESYTYTPKKKDNNPFTVDHNKTMADQNYDDFYADAGPEYYNIHGMSVSTVTTDDGQIFVPLDEVKSIGFELFEDNNIPKQMNFKQQTLDEFRVYLSIKARKYINKMKIQVPDAVVEETKNEIISQYAASGAVPRNTRQSYGAGRQSGRQNQSSRNSNGFEKQNTSRGSMGRDKPSQHESQKPLRKPNSTTDDTQGARIGGSNKTYRQTNFQNTNTTDDTQDARNGASYKTYRQTNLQNANTTDDSQDARSGASNKTYRQTNLQNSNATVDTQDTRNEASNKTYKQTNLQNANAASSLEKENISPSVYERRGAFNKPKQEIVTREKPVETAPPNLVQPSISRVQLPLNEPVNVTVSFVESKNKCWIYMKSAEKLLEELLFETNLQAAAKPKSKPVVGQICAATYCGSWYRALVLQDTPSVKVRFVDFGNCNEEEVRDVRELSPDLIANQALAVCVHFTKPPKTNLQDNVVLKIIATKKNDDESYQVEEFEERTTCSEISQLNVVPAGKVIKSPEHIDSKSASQSRPDSSRSVTSNTSNKSDKVSESISKISGNAKRRSTLNPVRKSVVDLMKTDDGVIQHVKRLDDKRCVCFIMPQSFVDEVTTLEEITDATDASVELISKVGDTVSVYKADSESFVRGSVLNVTTDKYVVALVDYGIVIETDKVSQLQTKYLTIPEFTCICEANSECIQLIEQAAGDILFDSIKENKIKVGFNEVFYNITCSRWDPFESFQSTPSSLGTPAIFTEVPCIRDVKDKERIMLVTFSDGKLLVRSKEANILFTKIKDSISKYNASALPQKPILDQLVLAPHDSITGLGRGIIKSPVINGYADVAFIDYGFVDTVPSKNMKCINEELAKEDSTLIPIVLKGFENGGFSDEATEIIERYCEQSKKVQARKYSNNVFDLIISETPGEEISLSEKLQASNDILMYKKMAKKELKQGSLTSLLCVSIETDGLIAFIPDDDDIKDEFCKLNSEICDYTKDNNEPYSPTVGEVCLANFEGEWYRSYVLKSNNAVEEYHVYYIDYGNSSNVSSADIRKIPVEFTKVPALALACYLTEIKRNKDKITPQILELLKNTVVLGSTYDVQVVQKVDDLYEIKIPSLSRDISNILKL